MSANQSKENASMETFSPPTTEEHEEHIVVRTMHSGQALRVTLVRDTSHLPHAAHNHYNDEVVAELVIAPGHRLVVESGGVRVEHL